MDKTLEILSNSETLGVRHDRVCLNIFLKQDKLKQSDTDTPFNEIFPDQEKVEKSRSNIV
jgi:hypothetical protein